MMISVCNVKPPESELMIMYSDLLSIALYNCVFLCFFCVYASREGTQEQCN